MDDASGSGSRKVRRSRTVRYGILGLLCLLLAGAAAFLVLARREVDLALKSDVYVAAWLDAETGATKPSASKAEYPQPVESGPESWKRPEELIRSILKRHDPHAPLVSLKIDYPLPDSIFPPEIVAPTFLWHDADNQTSAWLVDVTFTSLPHHIYVLTNGRRRERPIDPRCVTKTNVWHESAYQASARGWTPDEHIWSVLKHHSVDNDAQVTIFGLSEDRRVVSRGRVKITTSKDPVGAPIFYRDVPLMPSETKDGVIKPLKASATPLIKWRLRYLDKPESRVVMQHLPTCANCHSFSNDGRTIALDMDGPSGDKGAHVVKTVRPQMVIRGEDVFSWNSYQREIDRQQSGGLFPHVSPDGKHVVATVHESVFVQNYMDYRFLQTFYPTRGILAIYSRETGTIKSLPGADDLAYVQSNGVWSPDGQRIVFIRATARESYGPGDRAEYANDPRETSIQYDLYQIPFNKGKGGVPKPLRGASNNGMSNSFPKISPNGKWIVYVQAKNGLLQRPDSRLFIIPAQGGGARELICNMKPMNSWHSWSPNSRWLVFVSKTNTPYTQMFLTHIDEEGNDSPAILVRHSTAANRAVNLPEFANIPPGGLLNITTPAVAYRRHLDRGRELDKQGKPAEAIVELEKSIALKSDYPDTYQTMGNLFTRRANPERAIPYFRKALEIDPDFFLARNNLADALSRVKKYHEAVTHYKLALTINPRSHPTITGLGYALSRLGKQDEAIASFRKALALNPKYVKAHYYLGMALAAGDRDDAIAHFRQVITLDPQHYYAHYNVAALLSEQGHFKEAIGHFREAIRLKPRDFRAYRALAWILATHRDPALRDGDEAVRLAATANKLTGDCTASVLMTLAAAYAETGKFADAVKLNERALAIADAQREGPLADEIRAHLKLFRTKKPVRMDD